ncbi:MAG: carbamoyltransferase HypF [Candidatus Marinimicrobia bacterium]|nr:carbamoyltransferase HypF [Candidatus Neomarinimicrobiota bacterium]MBL7031250.1 carbamoyltransferase HypF [Candidatus Neomarinimicrobiota bacterium]
MPEKAIIISVSGAVQGVGFRPFIYKLAQQNQVSGNVKNTNDGVTIFVQGTHDSIQSFLSLLQSEPPPLARIQDVQIQPTTPNGHVGFKIVHSKVSGQKSAIILPDMSTCNDCLNDIANPKNRRYQYPFTNCTNCGPRFSIIQDLPYDRPNTSMGEFTMCRKCQTEYADPENRRFHAQPNACPNCGPQISFIKKDGKLLSEKQDALITVLDQISAGKIIGLKGLGGFQFVCDARNENAVEALRRRKNRPAKPFAIMVKNLEMAKKLCRLSMEEADLITSPEKPIVILKSKNSKTLSSNIAPGNPTLGLMLPYTPLHYLLMDGLGFPIVATSGNLANEPICIDENEALTRLKNIADGFLIHNRPIVRPVDDSVARIMAGKPMIIRRARGFAPLPILHSDCNTSILATGAHLKNTVTITRKHQYFMSQHIGNLETELSALTQNSVSHDFINMYNLDVKSIACDFHPDYQSTTFAKSFDLPINPIQHHVAHIWSVIGEHKLDLPVLGVAWDGTGLGTDNTIWGGEFFRIDHSGWNRIGHWKSFQLPGGDSAVKEPRRSALGLLYSLMGKDAFHLSIIRNAFKNHELNLLKTMFESRTNIHETTSTGRLFDAVSFLSGFNCKTQFEGQAAMDLEFAIDEFESNDAYSIQIRTENKKHVLDWSSMVLSILADIKSEKSRAEISRFFHSALSHVITEVSKLEGLETVCLSGGCFQNKSLLEQSVKELKENNFQPFWNQEIPINDGGISLGQAAVLNQGGQKECV